MEKPKDNKLLRSGQMESQVHTRKINCLQVFDLCLVATPFGMDLRLNLTLDRVKFASKLFKSDA